VLFVITRRRGLPQLAVAEPDGIVDCSIGRWDLSSWNRTRLYNSIEGNLMALPSTSASGRPPILVLDGIHGANAVGL
jgi:hypothetical protein